MSSIPAAPPSRSVSQSLREYGRGVAGGFLFSLPLLYTMEIWWTGFTISPLRLLLGALGAFGLLLGYNRYAGLRQDASFAEVVIDSVEELGIGIVIATVVLWLMGQITSSMVPSEIIGKIVIEAMTVAIGVSVGTAQLGGGEDDTGIAEEHGQALGLAENTDDIQSFSAQLVLSLCGAVLFAANVAPTDEILMIAFEATLQRLLGLVVLSLLLSALILFFSDFTGSSRRARTHSLWSILFGIIINYAVALVASSIILWFFNRYDGLSLGTALAATVVLGVAASLGASAGRLLFQTSRD